MPERPLPTDKEVRALIHDRRNWGRWGKDDQLGAINLITPAKRATAARLVRTGRSVSLSRPFPKEPKHGNPHPAQHWMKTVPRGEDAGFSADFYGIFYHGIASTHLDALCHTWDDHGMWNGRDPDKEITFDGATFGGVQHWRDGLITRGVLLDVPKFDFNWQLHYELAAPLKLPAGSKLVSLAHYDNSIKNRYNPAPDKEVFWSEQSWDEMFIPWFEYIVDSKDLTKQAATQSATKNQ